MADLVRLEVVETAQTLVVKIGTNVLSRPDDSLDIERLQSLCEQIHRVRQTGRQVVIVTSGAVAVGMGILGLKERPRDLPHLQAAAAAGQAHLIRLYDDCLRPFGYHAAQLLVTANDFQNRRRYLNVRNTLHTLFEYGVIPVVNENDTVSVAEIKFGDNDHLAAMVTHLLHDPLLVILSIVDGLFDGDPNLPESRAIPLVSEWDDNLLGFAVPTQSRRGTGGMSSKLAAVRKATAVGENVIIADGTRSGVLDEILRGNIVGTLFLAEGASIPAWKRWIGYTITPRGQLQVDAGAKRALMEDGRSLLAIGMQAVKGEFSIGELVTITDADGREFARGLVNYSSADAALICRTRTEDIAQVLGSLPYSEVIHRDNLAILAD